jgi:hypothetical protein
MLGDLLRSDITIRAANGYMHLPEDIANAENYYRRAIYDKLGGKTVGKTVFIGPANFYVIRAVIKAAWDLGCNVFNQEGHPAYRVMPEFKNFYDFIDVIVLFPPVDDQANAPHTKWVQEWMPEKHVLTPPMVDETIYPEFHPELDQPVSVDTIAIKTHTSGTTGFPKIIDFTHRRVIELADHTIEYNGLEGTDRPLHNKTMHHGSLFVNYAIPLLMLCQNHYDGDISSFKGNTIQEQLYNALVYIKNNKITRWLLPYSYLRTLPEVDPIDLEGRVALNGIVGPFHDQMKVIFEKFNPRHVINMFGSSEMGTMFISKTTKENIGSYNHARFDIVNPYIDYEVHPTYVRTRWKTSESWYIMSDRFKIIDGVLWLLGRNDTVTIDGDPIDTADLFKFLADKYKSTEFTIVQDFELNKLYLAVFEPGLFTDLATVNQYIKENYTKVPWGINQCFSAMNQFEKVNVVVGMKPSAPLLLYYFRNQGK